jgi:hypothetical protein
MAWYNPFSWDDDDEPKAPKKTIIRDDNYVGKVQGNLLDAYQNTSYNLKLYMIPAKTPSGGGWMHGAMAAHPSETVVIAQTSVTGVQIDNLDLSFVQSPQSGGSFAVRAAFTLIQPGAADLLDQIQAAKSYLGHYMYADVPMFLAIEFKGYEEDITDEDAGGAPAHITGPFIYQLKVAKVAINIDDTGSQYEFECPIGNSEAYADFNFKLPKDMYVQGDTIEELTEHLQKNLKKFKEDNLLEEEYHDEILFDLSQLKNALGNDTSIVSGSNRARRKDAEQVNRLMNAESQGVKTKEEFEKALEDNPDSLDGGVTVESAGYGTAQQINMKEGTSMNQFFTTALVMSDKFLDMTSRKKSFRDPVIDEEGFDLKQAFVKWYRIESDIEYLEFDTRRNQYAKRITYKVFLYDIRNDKQNLSQAEEQLEEDQVTHIIRTMNIIKAYNYLYTGLNDQVLNADIQFNAGIVLLSPPGAGYLGDLSTNSNKTGANVNKNSDPNGADRKADIADKQDAFLKKLGADDPFNRKLQKDLQMSDKEYKEFVTDKAKRPQREKTAKVLAEIDYDGTQPKADTDGYKPEASEYIYSADIIDDEGGSKDIVIGNIKSYQQNQNNLNKVRIASGALSPEPINKRMYGPSIISTSGDTSDGTNAATLFGYMYQNVNDKSILMDLGLKVRGDPYYLGSPTSYAEALKGKKIMTALEEYDLRGENKVRGMDYKTGDQNYFLFTMQTPRVRDPNIDDEDENTGYLKKMDTAYFISGIYMIIATTCSFQSGMFTVNMDKAPKQTSLPLSKFKLTNVDYGDGDDFDPAAEADAYNAEQTRRKAEEREAAQTGGNG